MFKSLVNYLCNTLLLHYSDVFFFLQMSFFDEFLNDDIAMSLSFFSEIHRWQEIKYHDKSFYFVQFKTIKNGSSKDSNKIFSTLREKFHENHERNTGSNDKNNFTYPDDYPNKYLVTCKLERTDRDCFLHFTWDCDRKLSKKMKLETKLSGELKLYGFDDCFMLEGQENDRVYRRIFHVDGLGIVNEKDVTKVSEFHEILSQKGEVVAIENTNKFIKRVSQGSQVWLMDPISLTRKFIRLLGTSGKIARAWLFDESLFFTSGNTLHAHNLKEKRDLDLPLGKHPARRIMKTRYGFFFIFYENSLREFGLLTQSRNDLQIDVECMNVYPYGDGFLCVNDSGVTHFSLLSKECFEFFSYKWSSSDFASMILSRKCYSSDANIYEGEIEKSLVHLPSLFDNVFDLRLKKTIIYMYQSLLSLRKSGNFVYRELISMLRSYMLTYLFWQRNILFSADDLLNMQSNYMCYSFYLEYVMSVEYFERLERMGFNDHLREEYPFVFERVFRGKEKYFYAKDSQRIEKKRKLLEDLGYLKKKLSKLDKFIFE